MAVGGWRLAVGVDEVGGNHSPAFLILMSVLSRFPRASLPLSETTRFVVIGKIMVQYTCILFLRYEELNRFWRTAKKRAVACLLAPHAVQCLCLMH
jgi:hypothetical protein